MAQNDFYSALDFDESIEQNGPGLGMGNAPISRNEFHCEILHALIESINFVTVHIDKFRMLITTAGHSYTRQQLLTAHSNLFGACSSMVTYLNQYASLGLDQNDQNYIYARKLEVDYRGIQRSV